MRYQNVVLFLSVLCMCFDSIISLRILGLFPYQGKSHFFVFKVYLEELARRGHDVTVVSHFPDPKTAYKDISLAGTAKFLEGDVLLDQSYLMLVYDGYLLTSIGADNCEKMLGVQEVQNLWKTKQKFDLVVTELFNSDCSIGLAHKLGAPVVSLTTHCLMPFHYERFGIPDNVAFVPFHMFGGGSRPTFLERIEALAFRQYFNFIYKYFGQRWDKKTLEKHFGEIPDLDHLAKEIKFLLLYHSPPLTGSRLFPTNVIEVGGYHVAPAKPLTGDLKKFIDDAPQGVVYASFGSMVKTSSLSSERLQAIIGALSQLKQRVIWKWEADTLPGNPANILSKRWLPQNDILAHPNVVAFYSHGGMLGTTEAIHHGVPMVVMPIFGDQPANAASIKESGLGVILGLADLSTNNLLAALSQVLQPEFRSRVKELSRRWHDRPLSALDTAVFWTEFAARHPNTSMISHATGVPCYKYYSLDLLALFLIFLLAQIFFVRWCCCVRTKTSADITEKRNKKRAKRD